MFAKLKAWFLKTNKDGETSLHIAKIVTVATFAILLAWGGFTTWVLRNYEHLQDSASYGDSFGAVNSLFSALALAGVVLAILMQREELILQRRELEETREVLKEAADAQKESMKALKAQAESAFLGGYMNALQAKAQFDRQSSEGDYWEASRRLAQTTNILQSRSQQLISQLFFECTEHSTLYGYIESIHVEFVKRWVPTSNVGAGDNRIYRQTKALQKGIRLTIPLVDSDGAELAEKAASLLEVLILHTSPHPPTLHGPLHTHVNPALEALTQYRDYLHELHTMFE